MFRILLHQHITLCQFKIGKVEPRRDRTPYQSIFANRLRSKPAAGLHHRLETLPFSRICPKTMCNKPSAMADLVHDDRVAIIKMP